MPILRRASLPSLLLLLCGCDNVGRVWDPVVEPNEPNQNTVESTVEVVPVGGDVREGRPTVRKTYPSGGGWPTAVPIVVEFSESVNQASIKPTSAQANDARLLVRAKSTTQALPCQYDFLAQGRLLVMRPIAALPNEGTPTYEVVLLPDARDCDGVRFNVPAEGTVLSEFQVNQDESFVDGRILAQYPRDNASDMSREGEVVLVFDRPATLTTLVAANFQVRPAGGAPLAGDLTRPLTTANVPDGRAVGFLPAAIFAASTGYEIVVTAGIKFGAEGELDFRGRTPYARFDTVGPQQPTRVALGNPAAGYPDKINLGNVATATLEVDTPDDALAGDTVRARIYGGDATTTGIGDLAFVEQTVTLTQNGAQTVAVDFSGKLGSAAHPEFDDGELSFAAQLQRGSQTSGFIHHPGSSDPAFDVTPPTVQRAGPPGSADGRDLWTDTGSVAFYGVASERLAAADLTAGTLPLATMYASDAAGRFLVRPIDLGRMPTPLGYVLTVTDTAGNMAATPFAGTIAQRGMVTGTLAGTLTIEAYDQATLAPIAGATVLVDEGVPVVPAATTRQVSSTDAAGRAAFAVTAPSHTVTIVRAGYDVVTMYTTPAAFVSLPLRPATNATATWKGTVLFTQGPGVTAVVGNTAVDDRSVRGVLTASATPTTIPDTPIVANRPQVITGFAGVLEPTANPPFSAHGAQILGATFTQPAPPGAPAAGGTESPQNLTLAPSTGQITALPGTYNVDFALATGLDFANLIGGAPRVRTTASLKGFEGQALVGLGWVTATAASQVTVNAGYSTPIAAGFAPFGPLLWNVVEARDTSGRISRSRALVTPVSTILGSGPFPLPTITTPGGPATVAPSVEFVDGLDLAVGPDAAVTLDVTATDAAGRRWVVYVVDRDAAGGTDTVQFPDLASAAVQGLALGDWSVVVEGRLWSTIAGGTADDCVLTERVRTEVEYSRAAAVTFTVQ